MSETKGKPHYKADFNNTKRRTIKAAEELYYSKDIIAKLKKAKTETELTQIMKTARTGGYKK